MKHNHHLVGASRQKGPVWRIDPLPPAPQCFRPDRTKLFFLEFLEVLGLFKHHGCADDLGWFAVVAGGLQQDGAAITLV